ncbi:MAG: sulfite exporter TauE/SafE family protein [Elusimicrobiota bacterium]|nr:sulfite exporter TauE/SafE family protein [Endomicrobiia bacterium]MDW8165377.1 sulfite exporter TauE/SafE family protein [Elusimicrobiota bacterium]
MTNFQFLLLGLVAGIFGGILGIGGGTIIIPYLTYISSFSQHQAQGISLVVTTLPTALLAVIKYYKEGNINFKIGLLISIGFFIGGYLGAVVAHKIPDVLLKKIFGIYLFIIAFRMILG